MFGVQNWDPGGKAVEKPRAGGRARNPAHVPRSDPRGEGVISAPRWGSEGRELRGGGGGRSPARSWGGVSGSALVPSLAFDQLIPDPLAQRARGTDPTGRGATRGRSHPVSAVGEGAVRRAFRSPGYAAESGTRGSRATGIPGRGASQADEFPAAGTGTAPGGGGERGPGTLEPSCRGTGERGGGPPVMPKAP